MKTQIYASLIALMYILVLTASAMSDVPCMWKVSVISSTLEVKEVPFKNDQDLTPLQETLNRLQVNYMLPDELTSYFAYPYFLHLNVICNNRPSPQMARTLYSIGVHPQVSITHRPLHIDQCHDGGKTKYTMTGAVVNLTDGDGSDLKCEESALLCHPSWVIPLIMDECSVMIEVYVDTRSADLFVRPTRQMINADGYTIKQAQPKPDTIFKTILGTLVDIGDIAPLLMQHEKAFKITSIPSATPSLVLGGIGNSNNIIVTATEFKDYQVVEVSIPHGATSVCGYSSEYIRQAITLPDRIVFSTSTGLYELFGFYGFLEDASSASPGSLTHIHPAHCVKEFVLSTHTYTERVVVLAVGMEADKEMVWVAEVQTGIPLEFTEVTDETQRSPCDVFAPEAGSPCSIVSAGISGVHQTTFTFLLLVEENDGRSRYYLASMQGNNADDPASDWRMLSWFSATKVPSIEPEHEHPIQIAPVEDSEPMVTASLNISGLTFIGLVSEHLFMWGHCLLYSPDGGVSVYILTQYSSSSDILILSVSSTNAFAFINDQQELWYGIVGNTVELHKLRPSAGWSVIFSGTSFSPLDNAVNENMESILTVFYDHDDQLFELVMTRNVSSDRVDVSRRAVMVTDIVEYQNYVQAQEMEDILKKQPGDDNDIMPTKLCPFISISFEAKISQFNERVQCFTLSKPHLTNPDQMHTADSLMVYQGIVHQTIVQSLQDKPKGVVTLYDPVARWKNSKSLLKDYYEWLYRTKRITSGIHVPIEEYGKLYVVKDHHDHLESKLPSVIYLDLGSYFNFTVHLSLDLPSVHEVALDSMWLTVDVSDTSLIDVLVTRKVNHLTNNVIYQVRVHDRGVLNQQALPGLQLHPASVLLQVWDSAFKCSQQTDTGENELQGSYSMDVLLGCSPGTRLIFDLNSTLEYAVSQYGVIFDCPGIPNPDLPCFYYKHDFYPFFQVLDLVTGKAEIFTGAYTFRVIGGSHGTLDELRYFDQKEQDLFNLQNNAEDETLIWIPIEGDVPLTNDSAVIFNHEHNGVLWSCQQNSACSDVPLRFPYAPEYFFLIEVSNRDVDAARTYCNYTVQFVIRVHGFQISPMRSVRIVLWTFAIFCLSLLLFVLWNQNKHHPITMPKCLKIKRKPKVVPIMIVDEGSDDDVRDREMEEYMRQGESLDHGDNVSTGSGEEVLNVYAMESAVFRKVKQEQESLYSMTLGEGSRHPLNKPIAEETSDEESNL